MSRENTIEVIARAVIRRGDQVLLCRVKDGGAWWFLPGGHVEHGEPIAAALLRELDEELGLRHVAIKSLIGNVENMFLVGDRMQHEVNFVFEAEETDKQPIECREAHLEFAFLDVNETLILPTALQNGLLEWLNSGKTFWKGLEP